MSAAASRNEGGEVSIRKDDVLRIVLVGKTGNGKSATGNTILGSEAFESRLSPVSVTSSCMKAGSVVIGRWVSVVDTPGLFDTECNEDETIKELSECISSAAPGPHAFLVVIKLDRFTDEEQRSVELIQKCFGEKSNAYTMLLFTNSDRLKGQPVKDFLKESQKLQALIRKCKGGYHVFNNEIKDPSQVNELLEKITKMVLKNGGSHYTNEMFQEAAREMEREKERQSRAEKEEKEREIDRVRREMRAEVEEKEREKERAHKEIVDNLNAHWEAKESEKERERREIDDERRANWEEEKGEMKKKWKEEKGKMEKKWKEEKGEMKKKWDQKMREGKKDLANAVCVVTGSTGAYVAVGGAIGGALGAFEIGALSVAVAGPVGAAVGAVVGLGSGLACCGYKRFKNRNTSEE